MCPLRHKRSRRQACAPSYYEHRPYVRLPRHAPTSDPPPGDVRHRGFPVSELIDDFRLAQVSRFLDDREIALQKQSRVFFQISGAGHEALLLGLARHLRPAYDWFFPYYRDRALMLGLGVTPDPDPAAGGRLGRRPGRPAAARCPATGATSGSTSSPSRAPPAASASPRSAAPRRPATSPGGPTCPGCTAHGDELTYVSLGEGATSEGEFWESLNTACTLHLPVLYVVADNGYAISVPSSDQSPAPISRAGPRASAACEIHKIDGRDYFASPQAGAPRPSPHVRAGVGPVAHPRHRDPALLPLGRRHPEQVPLGRGAGRRGGPRPDQAAAGGADRAPASSPRTRPTRSATRPARSWPTRPRRRWPAAGPTRPR